MARSHPRLNFDWSATAAAAGTALVDACISKSLELDFAGCCVAVVLVAFLTRARRLWSSACSVERLVVPAQLRPLPLLLLLLLLPLPSKSPLESRLSPFALELFVDGNGDVEDDARVETARLVGAAAVMIARTNSLRI